MFAPLSFLKEGQNNKISKQKCCIQPNDSFASPTFLLSGYKKCLMEMFLKAFQLTSLCFPYIINQLHSYKKMMMEQKIGSG